MMLLDPIAVLAITLITSICVAVVAYLAGFRKGYETCLRDTRGGVR